MRKTDLMSLIFANFFTDNTQPLHTVCLYNSHLLWRCLLILTLRMSWLGRYICRAFQIFISILNKKCLDILAQAEKWSSTFRIDRLCAFSRIVLIVIAFVNGWKNFHFISNEMFADSKIRIVRNKQNFSDLKNNVLIV